MELIKFDKFSITMLLIAIISGAAIAITIMIKQKSKNMVLASVLAVVSMCMSVISMNLWLFAGTMVVFAVSMFIMKKGEKKSVGVWLFLATVILSAACIVAAAVMSNKSLGASTVQTVVACVAMEVKGARLSYALMLTAVALTFAGAVVVTISSESIEMKAFVVMYQAIIVWNIIGRFLPDYYDMTEGNIVKYAGAGIFVLMSMICMVEKKWEKAMPISAMACTGLMAGLMGTGYPLTAWLGLMMMIQFAMIITAAFVNEMTEKNLYVNLVVMTGMILIPVADITYKSSIIKAFFMTQNMAWNILIGAGELILIATLGKMIWKTIQEKKAIIKWNVVLVVVMFASVVCISMIPVLNFKWIYPMMSQTELMVANIVVNKIPLQEIIITGILIFIMYVVTLVPVVTLLRAKRKNKADILIR